ncbi:MAG TPA: GNAT family N-acetyltransferase [Pyrinomonadaceae bacterium]|jgi:RimJ/RimL family protein N-acetyltransferase|nr:GNAT family N-acetyltransferase [Pyrinomonadaceae bacterium]
MIVLETERLILRHLDPDTDVDFILRLVSEPPFIRYIGDKGVRTLDDARRYIVDGPLKSYEINGYGLYKVELKSEGTAIGMCGLVKRDTLPEADIGFAFLQSYWKQGYAYESAAAVMIYARENLGMDRILAITTPDNVASGTLLNKIGLRFDRLVNLTPDAPEVKLFTTDNIANDAA